MVQFDLLPSSPPPPSPSNSGDKSSLSDPGMGNCLRWSCPGGRGGGENEKCLLFDKSFLAQFTRWLRISALSICKEKRRNFSESGWRGKTYQNLSMYTSRYDLKFETNVSMIRTRMDFIFWKRKTEIFVQPIALMIRKLI